MNPPTFSFIVPAFNEGGAVTLTIQSALAQTLSGGEVVVVDDGSTDQTSEIVERIRDHGRVGLVRHERNRGAAAARNSGIDFVAGEIVVFLDADVDVPPDFLARLAPAYDQGADAVAVQSRVADLTAVVGRFQQAVHDLSYPDMRGIGFSQAFSCRRRIAAAIRFREDIPGAGAEDGAFFFDLRAAGASCVRKPDIVVTHRLPTTVPTLWHQAVKRGRAIPHADVKLGGRTRLAMITRRLGACARAAIGMLVIVPALLQALHLARRSPRGLVDLPAFWFLHHVFQVGQKVGELSEALRIALGGR